MINNKVVDSNRGISIPSIRDENNMNQFEGDIDGSSVHESSSSSDEDTSTTKIGSSDVNNVNDNSDENNPLNKMTRYAATENKLVNRWRWIVIISILLVGAIVCSITYTTLNKAQINDSKDAVRFLFITHLIPIILHFY
jgi:hypothetical protein